MADHIGNAVTLRGLELFEELSRVGSMRTAAQNLGMSAPAASQQLKNLETAVGRTLVEHNRRPLELNRDGRAYLAHVRAALMHLRQGAAELSLTNLRSVRSLRLGIIDDFDSEVTPRLAVALASVLTPAELTLMTNPSLRILEDVAARHIDLGIAVRPLQLPDGVSEVPLLRDPFVLVSPRGYLARAPAGIENLANLPFLRYEKSQLLGRQIAAHLSRLRLAPEGRIELDSNQAIFGLIASGSGWAISTPVGFLRARRFQDQVDLFPLPFVGFARTISLFSRQEWMPEVGSIIAASLRSILRAQVVDPGHLMIPWIADGLTILPG